MIMKPTVSTDAAGIFDHLQIPYKVCTNGPEALLMIARAMKVMKCTDLIITDHQMTVMDGITLVKEIKGAVERAYRAVYPNAIVIGENRVSA